VKLVGSVRGWIEKERGANLPDLVAKLAQAAPATLKYGTMAHGVEGNRSVVHTA